jgi:Zn-dependent peptidase ImmA (M78 family)
MPSDFGFGNSDFGLTLAHDVIKRLGTNNVFEIAEKLTISIVYEKWYPVTVGEFDRKNRRITVNENAGIPFEKIIAHELGHYFLGKIGPQSRRDAEFDEEKLCDEFAVELLKNG